MAIEDIETKADLVRLIDKRIEQTPTNKIQGLATVISSILNRLTKAGI